MTCRVGGGGDSTSPHLGLNKQSSQFKNNFFTEMCSGSEAGSYIRLIDFVYHSTLGLRVIKKERTEGGGGGTF